MERKYVYAAYIMERTTDDIRLYDLLRLSHLNISFGLIDNASVTVAHLKRLDRIQLYKAVNPELRVNLSIGGWGADGFSQAAMTSDGRERLTSSAIDLVKKWGFDGIDIDWEYPCSNQAEIACDPADKQNFTLLMQSLRAALDAAGKECGKKLELSCAVGGSQSFVDGTEMDKVSACCDYVNLMTYDLRGGFATVTGHHTNLGPQTGDESGPSGKQVVELFHDAGVPYEKMVFGSAFYGRAWEKTLSDQNHGLGQPAAGVGSFHVQFNLLDEEQQRLHGFTRYWDAQAEAPYLFDGKTFVSYEDEESLKAKCDYVKEKGLAGLMYWAYGNHVLFEVPAHELMGFAKKEPWTE